jgi:hypothetical protein
MGNRVQKIDLDALPSDEARDACVLLYFSRVQKNAAGASGMDDPWRDMPALQRRFTGDVQAVVRRLVAVGSVVDEGDGTYCHHRVYKRRTAA